MRTFHVAPHGSDRATGSRSEPFLSLQRAADVVRPGDSVLVAAGRYSLAGKAVLLDLHTPGTSERPIVWRADPGAILDGGDRAGTIGIRLSRAAYTTVRGFIIEGFEVGISSDDSLHPFTRDEAGYPDNCRLCRPATAPSGVPDPFLVLQDLDIRANDSGILLDAAPDATLRNLRVHGNGRAFAGQIADHHGEGVRITFSDRVLVEGLEAYDNDDGDDGSHRVSDNGLAMYACNQGRVRRSRFRGNNMNLDLSGDIAVESITSSDYRHAGLVSRRRWVEAWAPHTVRVLNAVFFGGSGQAHIKSLRGGQLAVAQSTLFGAHRSAVVFRALRTNEYAGKTPAALPGPSSLINNLIVASSGFGIELQRHPLEEQVASVRIESNGFYANVAGDVSDGRAVGSLRSQPDFVDSRRKDFRLLAGTAAAERGRNLLRDAHSSDRFNWPKAALAVDRDGRPRGGAHDATWPLGAYAPKAIQPPSSSEALHP